jgi:hypothetical protein
VAVGRSPRGEAAQRRGIRFNIARRIELRPISGFDDREPPLLSWMRLCVGEPDLLRLAVHSDALAFAVERLGPFIILSLEINVRFIRAPVTAWVLREVEAWSISDGYATGPARLWDEAGHLCAVIMQTARVRPMPEQ